MKKTLLLVLLFPLFWASCLGESDYESDTGTFSIPWGSKEGDNVQEEDIDSQISAMNA